MPPIETLAAVAARDKIAPSEQISDSTGEESEFLWSKVLREISVVGGGAITGIGDGLYDLKSHPLRLAQDLATSGGLMLALRGPAFVRVAATAASTLGGLSFAKQLASDVAESVPVLEDTWNSAANSAQNSQLVGSLLGRDALDAVTMLALGAGSASAAEKASIWHLRETAPINKVEGMESESKISFNQASHLYRYRSSVFSVRRPNGRWGSGFAITDDGVISTVVHAVKDEDGKILDRVTVENSRGRVMSARVAQVDQKNDIALLQLDLGRRQKLKPFALATESTSKLDRPVLGLGFPGDGKQLLASPGKLEDTFVVPEQLARAYGKHSIHVGTMKHLFSAAVGPGDSGGPLIDERGSVIGMITTEMAWSRTNAVQLATINQVSN
jgi:S1-C subfamily serine protease